MLITDNLKLVCNFFFPRSLECSSYEDRSLDSILRVKKRSEENSLSRVRLFATPRAVAHQAPRSMGFSRLEYWSGLPFPSAGDLPDPDRTQVSRIVGRCFTVLRVTGGN